MGTSLCPAWPRRSSAIRRRRFIASQTLDHFRFAAKLAGLSCPPTQFAACSVGRYTTSKIWQNSENGARCSSNGSTGARDRERSETKPPGECGLIGERASCFSAASSTIRTGAWLKSSRRFFFWFCGGRRSGSAIDDNSHNAQNPSMSEMAWLQHRQDELTRLLWFTFECLVPAFVA